MVREDVAGRLCDARRLKSLDTGGVSRATEFPYQRQSRSTLFPLWTVPCDPYAAAAHREHLSAVRGKERPPVLVAQRRYFEVEPHLFAVQGQDDVVEADEEVNVVLVSAG